MNYAMTIKDSIITVHESMSEITAKTFEKSPSYAGLEILAIKAGQEYQNNTDIRCYDKKGIRQPDVWCIEQGYMLMPPNHEIIGGELIKVDTPVEDAPITIKQMMMEQQAKIDQLLEMTKGISVLATEVQELKQRTKDMPVIDLPIDIPVKEKG